MTLTPTTFDTFGDAYVAVLRRIHDQPEYDTRGRGNDAVIGLLCDTFSFTMVQELAARRLGVDVGTYTHHVGSMHINVLDIAKVEAILAEADRTTAPTFPRSPMPDTSPEELATVLWWEQALRAGGTTLTAEATTRIPVPDYWRQVLLLFEAHRQIRHTGDPITADITAALTAGNRWLMAARWPDRIGAP
ncbi:hypothetical protein [Plantactinospora sp. KBS50]|uniref:hypothetical protein n=1 Tax=Plantactinospora sp. KBS50 TaxID=2024580 RepID=UPI000BAAD835|nr:hypothetical protein [Plantactinospora sp. KBS50]ASW53119.1 hypothetical protein CIK06_01340 [Plantactinospora sp. KBS50]